MSKSLLKKVLLSAGAVALLSACGNGSDSSNEESSGNAGSEETKTLTVGATNTPHGEILEFVKPTLEEEGVELDIVTYTDYPLINQALADGDLDANYFQHVPYFNAEVEENGYDFANAGGIHIEPIAAYSQRYEKLEDLPEGAEILVSSNAPDYGRILEILQDHGLIKLKEGVDITEATFDDIAENERNLDFQYDYDPALMVQLLNSDEGDVVFINSNFAVDNDINPVEDSIAIQSEDSPYANIIAVRSEDAENEAIQKLVDALHSEETQDYILENWGGSVVPVSK
ncbi:MetQ/NlpA family ABC transporter substrate-binding protein [Marinilactibacillus psychrotolerans]|uniref:Lipoprotein n=2 Tax=Marinilactibacillus psychrotolerans TaxID=191770 RepID=A0A511H207_9LACT|nr:MetQ/NlpA family ABC transporter substrate-binding protein [Marinilactibacillus psychrotolerans]TLQ08873.1 methionine ABC transporter substrate-binding protein [Marinilactibacillus psychrotolerans]SDC34884.1 D-methionine transport system substrate-binding protein [Marinilactibacillus psychrotolerans]SJN36080.1 Methionine ABC transporter substrate-binding protein [Marinilactibacillus psychrotolerans 42ea]GEL66799.1 lipoprotein [Marinilactibacillus psychrotolerans]GEQ33323.1 methionine ABC tr